MKNATKSIITLSTVCFLIGLTACSDWFDSKQTKGLPESVCSLNQPIDSLNAPIIDSNNNRAASSTCKSTFQKLAACDCDKNCKNENAVCCDKSLYCQIDAQKLKDYIANYRDFDWPYTSPLFGNPPAPAGSYGYKAFNSTYPNPATSVADLDSRYLDIDLQELENYLCVVKNSDAYEEKKINTIRLYYIRYDDDVDATDSTSTVASDYAGKHSLALVPVSVCNDGSTANELAMDIAGNNFIWIPQTDCDNGKSLRQNHNRICPPGVDCDLNTLLYEIDN